MKIKFAGEWSFFRWPRHTKWVLFTVEDYDRFMKKIDKINQELGELYDELIPLEDKGSLEDIGDSMNFLAGVRVNLSAYKISKERYIQYHRN